MAYEIKKTQPKFSAVVRTEGYQKMIENTLGDPQTAQKFTADIIAVVSQNNTLQNCNCGSIVASGLVAQRLNLPLAPTLGFAYVVPYKDKAQFQIGWKGLVQLAIRTRQYETIGVRPVHQGENKGYNEFGDETVEFSHEYDDAPVVGYFAYFKLTNGFKKTLYWTKEQCELHATKYSKSHSGNNKGGEFDNWSKMFDEMAQKTVLKQLLSKYGIMSVDFQTAIAADQATIKDDGSYEYLDNPNTPEQETVADPTQDDDNKPF